jgi:hypothetical protein
MERRRLALLIAADRYEDSSLRQLVCPSRDTESLARVLSDPAVGKFEVIRLLNKPLFVVSKEVDAFFQNNHRDDLLLLYFSCHGIKDADGRLYFACTDTNRALLRSTGLRAGWVNDVMQESRARRQVLLLDCCYSGAFARGMMAKADNSVIEWKSFGEQGMGRVVLTASNETQYAFEGDTLKEHEKAVESIFTGSLVRGLETGEPDADGKGFITLDELYDYVYREVRDKQPKQRPQKHNYGVEGQIVIALNPKPVIKPADLPADLQQDMKDPLPRIRKGAAIELKELLHGDDPRVALAANNALKEMENDDSLMVRALVHEILQTYLEQQDQATEPPPPDHKHEERIVRTEPGDPTGHGGAQPGGGESVIRPPETLPGARSLPRPSYWSGLGWNILFGFGLYHVDPTFKRKWVYPVCAISSCLAWYILLSNKKSVGNGAVDLFLVVAAVLGLAGWLLSFVRVVMAYRDRFSKGDLPAKLSYSEAIRWNLFLGAGLIYVAPELKRKWWYVRFASCLLASLALLIPVNHYWVNYGKLHDAGLTVALLGIVAGLLGWLVSFGDVFLVLSKRLGQSAEQNTG